MFTNNQKKNTIMTRSTPEKRIICNKAIQVNNIETVIESINKGADVNYQGLNMLTPLHVASYHGHNKMAELLIRNGAFVDATLLAGKDRGFTPLYYAVQKNNLECVKILLQKGASVSPKIEGICHPIHLAVFNNYPEIVELLLENGADKNQRFSNEFFQVYKPNIHRSLWFNHNLPLIHYVILQNFEKIFHILDNYNADFNSKTSLGRTTLMCAVEKNNDEWVHTLLAEKNVDVNARDNFGQPVIHFVVINAYRIESPYNLEYFNCVPDKVNVLKILMDFGVDINARFPEDYSHGAVINYMIMFGIPIGVRFMLEFSVNLNFNDIDLQSLYLAQFFPVYLTSQIMYDNNVLSSIQWGFVSVIFFIIHKAMSLKAIGHPVNEDLILKKPIHRWVSMEDFTYRLNFINNNIMNEITFMKKHTIDGNITLWDLLTCNQNQLIKLVSRKPFKDYSVFNEEYFEYSSYYAVIEKRVRDARKKKIFLEESTELISSLLIPDVPYDCCKIITSFLSDQDIIFC